MKFTNYITESMRKKYVAVQYDEDTQIMLRNWCRKNGFSLTTKFDGTEQKEEDFDFHTTIFFSTSEHDLKNGLSDPGVSGKVKAVGFELLGEDHDIPALNVEGEGLRVLRKKYEALGMKDAVNWKPHIILSYDRQNVPDVRRIKPPTFPISFDKIKIADAVDLWGLQITYIMKKGSG